MNDMFLLKSHLAARNYGFCYLRQNTKKTGKHLSRWL